MTVAAVTRLIKQFISFISGMPISREAEVSEPLHVYYRCSRCGFQNLGKARLRQKCDIVESGLTYPNVNIVEENQLAETSANLTALYYYLKKKETVKTGSVARAARVVRVTCTCERCGHKEPWAQMNYSLLPEAAIICGFVIVFFGLLYSIFGTIFDTKELLLLLVILYAACILFSCLAEGTLYLIRAIQIKRLPEESLPIFVFPVNTGQSGQSDQSESIRDRFSD